ncbi:FtsK/SpoIIIE domain-containing protein, partial [Nocardiopsis dassonvillei]|uniref:FtsK/SpoIIIE domain-containing protein n=1 Tax=Nocardiopsis dassonvillei TaxID=2014 RepID=UPI00307D95AE
MPATLTLTMSDQNPKKKTSNGGTGQGRVLAPEGWPAWLWQHIARPAPDSLRVMYRHVLTPWYWGVGVYGATAAYTAMAVDAGMAPAATALVAATTAGTAANLLPRVLRGKKAAKRWPVAADWVSREPGHARVVANVAAMYATLTAAAAPTTPEGWTVAGAAGVLTLMGCSARYWQHHRHHTAVVRPGAGGPAAPVSTVDETPEQLCARVRTRWASRVGCEGGILPGSTLRISPAPAGAAGKLFLVSGRHDLSSVTSVLGKIASALGVAKKYLAIEDYEPEDGSEPDPAVLTVSIMSARVRSRVYPLGDYQLVHRRGDLTTLTVGGVIDGSEMAEWLLYDDSGIRHGYLTGNTGAGKSVLMDTLVIGALETGVTSVLYIDPKGNSSPRIAKHAHVAVLSEDPKRWHRVLDGVLEGMAIRKALVEAGITNSSRFVPTPEFPGVLIAIDEIHRLTGDPDILAKLLFVAREGRSLGFGLLLASQGYTAGEWGGSTIFRALVTGANAIALKLDKDQGNSYFQDFGINPNKVLPDPNFVRKLPDGSAIKPYAGFAVSKALGQVPMRTLFDGEDGREERMAAAKAVAVQGMDVETYGAIDTGSGHLLSRADDEREQMRAAAAERVAAARRAGQA